MTQFVYDIAKLRTKTDGLDGVTFGALLIDQALGHVAEQSHEYVSDVSTYELVTDGYERKILANVQVQLDPVNHRVGLHANPVGYTAIGVPSGPIVQAMIIYAVGNDDSDSWLFAYLDSVTAQTNGDNLWVSFDAAGIAYF